MSVAARAHGDSWIPMGGPRPIPRSALAGSLDPARLSGHVHRMTHSDTLRQTFAGCTATRVALRQMVEPGRRRVASGSGFISGKSGGGGKRRGGRRQWRREYSAGPEIPLRCEFR